MKLSELKDKKVLEAYDVFDGRLTGDQANYIRSCVDAGSQAVMDEADKLADALSKIRSGLTTDINRVEHETKKLAHEYLIEWTKFKEGNDEPG